MLLVLASANPGKCREIADYLVPYGIELQTARQMGFSDEIPETGNTFVENAGLKAVITAKALSLPVLADDSGLCVEALKGRPGIMSARYAGPQADDKANNTKLLTELNGLPRNQRKAAFVCALVCAHPCGSFISSEGRLEGYISFTERGAGGFGYDPLLELEEFGYKTVAELTLAEKNAISHRAKAMAALLKELPAFLKQI